MREKGCAETRKTEKNCCYNHSSLGTLGGARTGKHTYICTVVTSEVYHNHIVRDDISASPLYTFQVGLAPMDTLQTCLLLCGANAPVKSYREMVTVVHMDRYSSSWMTLGETKPVAFMRVAAVNLSTATRAGVRVSVVAEPRSNFQPGTLAPKFIYGVIESLSRPLPFLTTIPTRVLGFLAGPAGACTEESCSRFTKCAYMRCIFTVETDPLLPAPWQ